MTLLCNIWKKYCYQSNHRLSQIYQKWLGLFNHSNDAFNNNESHEPLVKKGLISEALTFPLAGAIMGLLVFSVILLQAFRDEALKNFVYFHF